MPWAGQSGPRAGSLFSKELTEQESGEDHLTVSNGKETLIHLPV